jgi:hypothetical protein
MLEKSDQLEIGDVVLDRSAWVLMTVVKKLPGGLVECSWSHDGDVEIAIFVQPRSRS